jgi:hypothetical protein
MSPLPHPTCITNYPSSTMTVAMDTPIKTPPAETGTGPSTTGGESDTLGDPESTTSTSVVADASATSEFPAQDAASVSITGFSNFSVDLSVCVNQFSNAVALSCEHPSWTFCCSGA